MSSIRDSAKNIRYRPGPNFVTIRIPCHKLWYNLPLKQYFSRGYKTIHVLSSGKNIIKKNNAFLQIIGTNLTDSFDRQIRRVRNFGSREESKVAGFFIFSPIRMIGYFKLG